MDMNYNTYGDEDNEFEFSEKHKRDNKREQYKKEFEAYVEEWNNGL